MDSIANILIAVAAVAAVWVSYIKTKSYAKQGQQQIAEVHVLVNSKMAEALKRIETLEAQLKEAEEK
jgi:hypothetical protein